MHESAPATASFEASNEALKRICGAYRVVCDRWWDFRGSVRMQRIGSLELADIHLSRCAVIRDHHDEHYRGDHMFIVQQVEGLARMRQRGSEANLRPGDCTIIDSRYSSVFETEQGFRQYSFHIPIHAFHAAFGEAAVPVARTISGEHGAGKLLSEFLASSVRNASSLQGVELTSTTLQLLSLALGVGPSSGRAANLERHAVSPCEVTHYVDAHIQCHELTPQRIADHFNISVRQLYRVVAQAGLTPSALIWKQRLEHARTVLARSGSHTPIIEVALNCGFKDGAHFSRAYRKAFGHPPKVSRSAGPTWAVTEVLSPARAS